uniref:ABC transporter A family member 2-like n=1 Tax=Dermatophagoides pteronyssinus TaxID=6956 RepID=A0A6P6YJL8_DERPT|nr:ABC transporter A family member 2-like [Dermatophagoides pteronyssinus]
MKQLGLLHCLFRYPRQVSVGELRRFYLALILIGEPEVVLLDEPTIGLDITGRRFVVELLRAYRNSNVTLIFSTHFGSAVLAERLSGYQFKLLQTEIAEKGKAVVIRDLLKVFHVDGREEVAVNQLNLDLYYSEIFALLGHNGAGKTTTINMLIGLLPSDGGDYPQNLSGGQKRRLWLAFALINEPRVVFLDEPTSGVDPVGRHRIWEVIENERKSGRCIVLTTHHMEEADILADRKALMTSGKICCVGSSSFLKKNFGVGFYLEIQLLKDITQAEAMLDADGFG